MVSNLKSKGEKVEELEKQKGVKVPDRTLAPRWPDSPLAHPVIFSRGCAVAKKGEEWSDAAIGASGLFFDRADSGASAQLNTQGPH